MYSFIYVRLWALSCKRASFSWGNWSRSFNCLTLINYLFDLFYKSLVETLYHKEAMGLPYERKNEATLIGDWLSIHCGWSSNDNVPSPKCCTPTNNQRALYQKCQGTRRITLRRACRSGLQPRCISVGRGGFRQSIGPPWPISITFIDSRLRLESNLRPWIFIANALKLYF